MISKQTRTVCTQDGDVLRAKIVGEVDHHSAKDLREEIDDAILAARPRKVVLDLGAVDFMDSSGLGIIMGRRVFAEKLGAAFVLANPSRRVARIIELAGLARIIPIETTQSGGNEHA